MQPISRSTESRVIDSVVKEAVGKTISDADFLSTMREFAKNHKGETPGVEIDKKFWAVKDQFEDPKKGYYVFVPTQRFSCQIGYGTVTTFFDTISFNEKGWHVSENAPGKGWKHKYDTKTTVFKDSKQLMTWLEATYQKHKKG